MLPHFAFALMQMEQPAFHAKLQKRLGINDLLTFDA